MLFSLTLNNSNAAYIPLHITTYKGEGAALHHPLLCETQRKKKLLFNPRANYGLTRKHHGVHMHCWQTSKYPLLYSLLLTGSKVSPALNLSGPGAQQELP